MLNVRFGLFSTELGRPRHFRFPPDSDRTADNAACLKVPNPDIKLKSRIGRGLRNSLINTGSRGPIQEVERQKLEHGNKKRSDGFPKIMLVQADTSVQHLYDSRQRAQDL